MPSLIRFLIVLLFLGGLVYAGMFALVTLVEPTPRDVSVRIPARDLFDEPAVGPSILPGLIQDQGQQQNTAEPGP